MSNINENKIKEEAEKHLLRCRPGDRNHALRVVEWIKELGKNHTDLLLIITAGYIHDIGWEGVFPAWKEKITFDELIQFEKQANNNSMKFATNFLNDLGFEDDDIVTINRLIKAADEHKSEKDDEAVIVDADQLSKMNINHLKEKFKPSEWMKMHELWFRKFPERIQTEKGKEIYPSLLDKLKNAIEKEIATT
ncbi:MAG: HD domain-containing protein [Patescibacteria group bacterium]